MTAANNPSRPKQVPLRAVIFDMDGVLIDSEAVILKATIAALAEFGVKACERDFDEFIGAGAARYVGGVSEKYGVPYRQEMTDRAFEIYGTMISREQVAEGAREAVLEMRRLGLKTAVCSGAYRPKILHNLRVIGVETSDFDAFVIGDDVTKNKPDPEIYIKGIALLKVKPEECLVIEDTLHGLAAARAAGAAVTVGIGTTFSRDEMTDGGNCDLYIKKMTEFVPLVKAVLERTSGR